mgnify:CR=1 FL=1
MDTITVVVCGFDPYENITVNPSREVCLALDREGVTADRSDLAIGVTSALLPLSFQNAWPKLQETLEKVHPDIVIATGLKTHAQSVMLERCATNFIDATKPDADDVQPRRLPIIPHAPEAYWTHLPLHAILGRFAKHDIPASLSSDAGTFVCNSLFYQLLNWSQEHNRTLAGFVSLPLVDQAHGYMPGMSLDRMIEATREVVLAAVDYYRRPLPPEILRA